MFLKINPRLSKKRKRYLNAILVLSIAITTNTLCMALSGNHRPAAKYRPGIANKYRLSEQSKGRSEAAMDIKKNSIKIYKGRYRKRKPSIIFGNKMRRFEKRYPSFFAAIPVKEILPPPPKLQVSGSQAHLLAHYSEIEYNENIGVYLFKINKRQRYNLILTSMKNRFINDYSKAENPHSINFIKKYTIPHYARLSRLYRYMKKHQQLKKTQAKLKKLKLKVIR